MIWFVWANLAVLGCVWRWLRWVRPVGGPWMRALTAVCLGAVLIIGTTLGAGIFGVLRPEVLVVVPTLLFGASWFLPRAEPEVFLHPPRDSWSALGVITLAVSVSLWLGGPGWSGTRFVFDDITYHATVPAIWTQWQAIAYTDLTYQAYYPFNAELMGLWFLVPLGHFGHAGLGVLITLALLISATGALAEHLRVRPSAWMTLLAALLGSAKSLYFARTFSANDLAMAAFLLAMLAFAVRPPTLRTAVWSGLLAGVAVGTKVSAVPMVTLVGLVWLVRSRHNPMWVMAFFTATLPLGAYWYVHNFALTGNPLFPAEIGPFEGPLDQKSQARTTLAWFFANRSASVKFWATLFTSRLNWPVVIGVAAILGYVRALTNRKSGLWLVFAAGVLFLLLHPLQPFSATINRPASPLHEMHRYLAFGILVGLFLLAATVRSWRALTVAAALAWFYAVCSGWSQLRAPQMIAAGLAGTAAGAFVTFRVRPVRSALPVAIGVLLLMGLRTEAKRLNTVTNTLTFTKHGRYHTRAWRAVDKLPDGSAIAWISDLPPSHSFNLPNMGSRLQHVLVPLDINGKRHDRPLHQRWKHNKGRWWSDFKRRHPKQVPVLQNVLDSGADYLVISRCQQSNKGGWPVPHGSLRRFGNRARVHADRCAEVWELAPLRGKILQEPTRRRRKTSEKKK